MNNTNPPPQEPQFQTSKNEEKKPYKFQFKKLYFLIALLILLAGLTLINILISPFAQKPKPQQITIQSSPIISPASNDIGANWKTYNNQFFSLNYPANWEIGPKQVVYNPRYFAEEGALFLACSTSVLGVSAFDMSKYPSSYPTLDSYLKNSPQSGASSSSGKTIILGGEQAKYWEDSGDPGSSNPSARVVLFSNSKKLIVDLYMHDFCGKSLQQTSTIFNQILSTFRFD